MLPVLALSRNVVLAGLFIVTGTASAQTAPAPTGASAPGRYVPPEFSAGQAHPPMPAAMLASKKTINPLFADMQPRVTAKRQLPAGVEVRDGKVVLKAAPAKGTPGAQARAMDNAVSEAPRLATQSLQQLEGLVAPANPGAGAATEPSAAAPAAKKMLPALGEP